LIAQHTRLVGDIETEGALLVNGMVQGNGRIGGEVSISSHAQWEGDVHADCAVIAGLWLATFTSMTSWRLTRQCPGARRRRAKRIATPSVRRWRQRWSAPVPNRSSSSEKRAVEAGS
jgi:hypothetical protein